MRHLRRQHLDSPPPPRAARAAPTGGRAVARVLTVAGWVAAAVAGWAADAPALTRFYGWPPGPDLPQANGDRFWDWTSPGSGEPLVDLRTLNESVAGEHGWVRRDGDRFVLGDGRPVRFWAVNATGSAPLPALIRTDRALAQRGVNLIRIHGGASKSLLDFRRDSLDAINGEVIDQMHRAVVAARQAGIYTFVSNSFFIIQMKVKAAYGLEGYTAEWLEAHPDQQVPFGLVFLNDRLRAAFKGWLREFVTRPNPHDPQHTPLAQDRSVAVIELLNEENLFFFTFKPANWPREQRVLAGRKFHAWLGGRTIRPGETADQAVARVYAAWDWALPDDDLARQTLGLLAAGQLGPGGRGAARIAAQLEFMGEVQRGFHREMVDLLRSAGYGGLVSPSNWNTAYPELLLDLEHHTYREGDLIDRHAYFAPAVAREKLKYRLGVGDVFLGLSTLVRPETSPTHVRQMHGYPGAMSEFAWVSLNSAALEAPVLAASYFSLADFDLPVWFACGPELWDATLGKWAVGRPGVLGQFPGAALLFRRGDVATAPVVVREGRSLDAVYQRTPARIMPPRGFDAIRDAAPTDSARGTLDPLAMMVGRVEHDYDRSDVDVSPRVPECIDRAGRRVRSVTGELLTDWGRGVFTVDAPRSQGAVGFLRAAGRVDLSTVSVECQNAFAAVLVISLDDVPLVRSRRILLQVGVQDRLSGFRTEPEKVVWRGQEFAAERITALGRPPWQVEEVAVKVVLKGLTRQVTSAQALDADLRPLRVVAVQSAGADVRLQLPAQALYTLLTLE